MPSAMPYPDLIRQDLSRDVSQRVLQAQFHDGYWQTMADGPNSITEDFETIGWQGVTREMRDIIVAVLKKGATDYITWQPGNDTVSKKYLVKPISAGRGKVRLYREDLESGNLFTITTSISQVP